MEADSSDSTHDLLAELGVSFDPGTSDSLVDSLDTWDLAVPPLSPVNASAPSPLLRAASEPTPSCSSSVHSNDDEFDSERNEKLRGLSKEEAREKRKLWNKQERKRQRAIKDAAQALGRILPDKSMSRLQKGSYSYGYVIKTAVAYLSELTIEANSLNPEAFRHLHGNFEIFHRNRRHNNESDLASESLDLQETTDLPVLTAPSAPPMNPMPDTPISQPLETIHQNAIQVPYQPQIYQYQTTQNGPVESFLGQHSFIIDQAIHQQPTVAPKPEHFVHGLSNPTCYQGGWNPSPHSAMLQGHASGPHSSHPMNVPDQAVLYPGANHMGPRPSLMQPGFSAPSFPPLPYLPALASSLDCPHIFPTPIANKIMSNDSGYSGMASSITATIHELALYIVLYII